MTRGPAVRPRWLLFGLVLVTLLLLLLVEGYRTHQFGDVGTTTRGPATPAPAEALDGGPILLPDGREGVTSRALPGRTVALTFDDGPDPTWTPRILDLLRRQQVPGTFFVVGARVTEHPEVVRRELAEGHEIGLHTFTHQDLSALPEWRRRLELDLTRQAILDATGHSSDLVRPPYSSFPSALTSQNWSTVSNLARDGHTTVLADTDGRDWSAAAPGEIVSAAAPRAGRGAVTLLHDGGGSRTRTLEALETLIPALKAQGYRFTTVSGGLGLAQSEHPASGEARLQASALAVACSVAGFVATSLTWLLTLLGGLTVLRALVVLYFAHRHVRRIRRGRTASGWRVAPLVASPAVSVIVPAYNEAEGIRAAVSSLAGSDYPDLEVVVVDDGSTDGTAALVEALDLPGVRVVRQENGGKPAALNTGIEVARGEILVLVDGDTVFERSTVRRLVAYFDDPNVGAVAGNTKVGNRRGLLGRWQHLEYVVGFNLDRRFYDELRCMPTVPGAIGAFRRRVLDEVGWVQTDTLAEDTDLTMAVVRAGWYVPYAEDAVAWTEAPATLDQLWKQRYRWCYGTLQAMWKHRRALRDPGGSGRLGRIGLPYMLLFQVLLPLIAPVIDVYAIYGLVFLDPMRVAAVWLAFVLVQVVLAAYALRLDRERLRDLWAVPIQQFVYRQLMYLVVVESVVTALSGARLRWHKLHRVGLRPEAIGTPTEQVRPHAEQRS